MLKIRNAFTLAELMIATVLGVVIFGVVFVFVFSMTENINESKTKISLYKNFDDFYNDFYSYNYSYTSGTILATSLSGSNIMMFNSPNESEGLLFGPVSLDTLRIDLEPSVYENIVLGFRQLSSAEISNILSNNSNALNLIFQKDKLYFDLKVKDLSITAYNSGSLNDLEIIFNTSFNINLEGTSWSNLPKEDLLKINYTF